VRKTGDPSERKSGEERLRPWEDSSCSGGVSVSGVPEALWSMASESSIWCESPIVDRRRGLESGGTQGAIARLAAGTVAAHAAESKATATISNSALHVLI